MYIRRCPDCGANLDPGETCDCKRKGSPHANEIDPEDKTATSYPHTVIIPPSRKDCKRNVLRDIRLKKSVPPKEIVETIRALYPGFDKTLLSKCEHTEKYGIEPCRRAADAVLEKYSPEELERERHRRNGCHRLKHQISCRVDAATHARLHEQIQLDGKGEVDVRHD